MIESSVNTNCLPVGQRDLDNSNQHTEIESTSRAAVSGDEHPCEQVSQTNHDYEPSVCMYILFRSLQNFCLSQNYWFVLQLQQFLKMWLLDLLRSHIQCR